MKNDVKGLTLIALVITIVIIIIISGITLKLGIGENGLFSQTQKVVNIWQMAEINEQVHIKDLTCWMNEKIDDNKNKSLADITGYEITNTVTKDKYGNPITVPAGFKVVNPYDDVTKGIVIEDVSANSDDSTTVGSQFVWIPLGDVYSSEEHTEENKKTITLGRYTFDADGNPKLIQAAEKCKEETQLKTASNSSYYYQELLNTSSSNNAKAKDIEEFVTKALESYGYYIGRYEAGDVFATETARVGRNEISDPSNPVTCKSGVFPYNFVNQKDASILCQEMYNSGINENLESDLMNSYAWDTAIVFIQMYSGDENYSLQTGKNTKSALQKCGESILMYVDSGDEEHDIRCNIYDMAGNAYEWNTESISTPNSPCIDRGGGYDNSTKYYTSHRGNQIPTNITRSYYSFRPVLYL